MNKRKELTKNTIIILIGKLSTQFITFFLLPLYTIKLKTSEYGFVDLVITYISLFAPIISLQLEMAVFRYIIDCRNNEEKINKIISTSLIFEFFIIIIFSFLLIFINSFIQIQYPVYILFNIIVYVIVNNLMQIARGTGKNINYSISTIISGLVTIFLNLFFILVLNMKVEAMLLSMLISNILSSIYLFVSLKVYNKISIKMFDKKLLIKLLKYSWPLIPNGISWWIISVSDRTILSYFLGIEANGIYAISNKFPSFVTSMVGFFSLAWTESASLHINSKDSSCFFSAICNQSIKLFSSLSLVVAAIMPFVFKVMIGSEYQDAYNYIPILLLATFCNSVVSIYSAIYIANKDTKNVAKTSIAVAIINLIIDFLLVNKIGIYAASISTFIAYFVMMIYRGFYVKKIVKINYEVKYFLVFFIAIIFGTLIYYSNNYLIQLLFFIVSIAYAMFFNRKIIKSIFEVIKDFTLKSRKKLNKITKS